MVVLGRNRPAFKLQALFQIHNVILSAGSLLLLVLMLEEMSVRLATPSGTREEDLG